jgi:hypothetical protein
MFKIILPAPPTLPEMRPYVLLLLVVVVVVLVM